MKPTLFIADLHLSDDTPVLNDLFVRFLNEYASKAAALYILGDLFEAWVGDDDNSQTACLVADSLSQFAQQAPVYFIAGNRDFLLGQAFASRANMTLLPENQVIDLYGKKVLLLHGDELCLEDVAYQRYRKIMRHPWVCFLLLHLPFAQRMKLANRIRAKSRERKKEADYWEKADVCEAGLVWAKNTFPAIQAIIHGHTHRPCVHQHTIHQQSITRYVLPDWHHQKGGFLLVDSEGATLMDWTGSLKTAA